MHFQYQHNGHRQILGAIGMNTTQLVEADVNGAKESYLLALHFVGYGHQHVSKGSGQMAFHTELLPLHFTVLNISCFLVIS